MWDKYEVSKTHRISEEQPCIYWLVYGKRPAGLAILCVCITPINLPTYSILCGKVEAVDIVLKHCSKYLWVGCCSAVKHRICLASVELLAAPTNCRKAQQTSPEWTEIARSCSETPLSVLLKSLWATTTKIDGACFKLLGVKSYQCRKRVEMRGGKDGKILTSFQQTSYLSLLWAGQKIDLSLHLHLLYLDHWCRQVHLPLLYLVHQCLWLWSQAPDLRSNAIQPCRQNNGWYRRRSWWLASHPKSRRSSRLACFQQNHRRQTRSCPSSGKRCGFLSTRTRPCRHLTPITFGAPLPLKTRWSNWKLLS